MKRVLILNAGSSSLKWTILDASDGAVQQQGGQNWPHGDDAGHARAARELLAGLQVADAVGHRVVHGGLTFREAVLVGDEVRRAIAELAELAPLHNPAALAGMEAVSAAWPAVPQVAAFDTAFHSTLPDQAAYYALPREWTERFGLRRFGFHGLSVAYAVRRAAEQLGGMPPRLVVCHLGAGCSITAVANGRSVDTSMGFTPLEGLVMAARSGSVDPGLLIYLLAHKGLRVEDLDTALNDRSGLLGVSGVSEDLRQVLAAMDAGDARAALAYSLFMHSLVRMAGAMVAVLGGLDALVLTGGIGEHSARVRADLAAALAYTGLRLDRAVNEARVDDADLAAPGSAVRLLALTAREDLAILAEVRRLLPELAG